MFQSITRNSIKLRSSQTTLGCNMKKGWAHRYRKCLDSYHVIRCIPHQYEVSLKWRCDPGGPWGLKDNHSPSRSSLHLLLDYWFTSKRVHLHLKQRSLKGAMAHLSLHHSAHPEYLLMCMIRWFQNALFLSFLWFSPDIMYVCMYIYVVVVCLYVWQVNLWWGEKTHPMLLPFAATKWPMAVTFSPSLTPLLLRFWSQHSQQFHAISAHRVNVNTVHF